MSSDQELSEEINKKLGALLALGADRHLRETGDGKHRTRSTERILKDAGLSTREIGDALGKTRQAVEQTLGKEQKGGSARNG